MKKQGKARVGNLVRVSFSLKFRYLLFKTVPLNLPRESGGLATGSFCPTELSPSKLVSELLNIIWLPSLSCESGL